MNSILSFIACATCFGAQDAVSKNSLSMAVITLLAVVGVVLAGFLALIYSFWKRRGLTHE